MRGLWIAGLVTLLPVLCAQDAPARPAPEALQRDPLLLPRAREGRWLAWKPEDAIPAPLLADLQAGTRAYLAADYATAALHFFRLLEGEPDFPPGLYQLGVTYFRLRRYGDCARVFERFQEVAPAAVGATQALAHSYYSLGDYPAALRQYEAVLAARADSVEALRGYALTHMRLGHLERALELLDACLELSPGHPDATYWRGQTLFDLGRMQEARAAAEAARDLDPFDPRAWFLLSQVLFEVGEDEAADAAEARFLELNQLAQRVRTLEGLLLHEPRQVDVWRRLCDVQRAAGNQAGALDAIRGLLGALPEDLDVRVFAMDTLSEIGEGERALALAADVERDFFEVPEAWRRLRDFYGSIGDRVRQVRAGERYLRLGGDPKR